MRFEQVLLADTSSQVSLTYLIANFSWTIELLSTIKKIIDNTKKSDIIRIKAEEIMNMFNFGNMSRGGVNRTSKGGFKKHKAFTLAEVLITLTIIGIVASMTIPLVTANHKKVEYPAKLKKFYNTMNEAIEMAENDYNLSFNKWPSESLSALDYVKTYIAPYVKYAKIDDCNGDDAFHFCNVCGACLYLDDGGVACFEKNTDKHPNVLYDLNGERKPNRYGKDSFEFVIGDENIAFNAYDGRVTTCSSDGTCTKEEALTRSELIESCAKAKTDSDNTSFHGCSGLIKLDGWEIKDDYPHKL